LTLSGKDNNIQSFSRYELNEVFNSYGNLLIRKIVFHVSRQVQIVCDEEVEVKQLYERTVTGKD
jgi:hypothetical protein